MWSVNLVDAEATVQWGKYIGEVVNAGGLLYLNGGLGAGKTTLTRGILQQLGHQGAVKSPTYTLVETYQLAGLCVYHFDLYRLTDPEELELIGVREYFASGALVIVEWPTQGEPILPKPDMVIDLQSSAQGEQRSLTMTAHTEKGHQWSRQIKQQRGM
jgi:tRNA threonylcarbamoyladenosine biosynthesis protein TsaE